MLEGVLNASYETSKPGVLIGIENVDDLMNTCRVTRCSDVTAQGASDTVFIIDPNRTVYWVPFCGVHYPSSIY